MSKYKIGDKVLIEGEIGDVMGGYYRVHIGNQCVIYVGEDTMKDVSKTYEDGLNDAWELARQIVLDDGMECDTFMNIFGTYSGYEEVLKTMTPQEALAKIEAYEESKAIKVGDVVKHIHAEKQYEFVVTILNGMSVQGIGSDGKIFIVSKKEVEKTGRHIDIEHLLEQIRGNE